MMHEVKSDFKLLQTKKLWKYLEITKNSCNFAPAKVADAA